MKEKKPKLTGKKALLRALGIYCASLIGVVAVIFGVYSLLFAKQIYPRVSVAGVMVGGLSEEEARERLKTGLEKKSVRTIIVVSEDNRSFTVKPDEIEATYDIEASAKRAVTVGRDKDFLTNLTQKLTVPFFGLELPAVVRVNNEKFEATVKKIVTEVTVPEKNADLAIKEGVVTTSPAKIGTKVDQERLTNDIKAGLGTTDGEPVTLRTSQVKPDINDEAATAAKVIAEAVLATPITFTDGGQNIVAPASAIGEWIVTKPAKGILGSTLTVEFSDDKLNHYMNNTLAKTFETEARNARLAFSNGQVQIVESSQDGKTIDRDAAKAALLQILALRKEIPTVQTETASPTPTDSPADQTINPNVVTLKISVKKPDVSNDNIASLGIKERIAISETDFKGSPNNRQENIRVGTRLFNGIILKPGDQFSSVKALGKIDESSGFKPELVIKQDQLIPEVGGGLCQVSTTLFRAALNAGLKIDERRNHRFRVSYYEARVPNPDPEDYVSLNAKTLVGLDATIYDPSPDFKFTNDTGSYMLIQGKVEGTRLTFELFGTKDGRQTSIEGPFITSTTPAPTEIQYIDDPSLPTGTTKLKERAAAGAKTNFKYKVTKEGKTIHDQTFTSSYTTWQAKYYRGTGPAASPSPAPSPVAQASPSPAVAGATTESPLPTPAP